MHKVLIIDDDTDICFLLKEFLKTNKYSADTAFDGKTGLKKLKTEKYDVVLCDFRLPDCDGFELFDKVRLEITQIPFVFITGYSDVKIAVKAMKKGVFEYVTKPILPEEILHTIQQAIKSNGQTQHNNKSSDKKTEPINQSDFSYVEGTDAKSVQVNKLISLVGPTDMSVLILGESGTGKEYVAKKLHLASERKNMPFIALDCGAIPANLASSELFGHVKGSFTGAINNKKGHFELANGGTLFLDEIGNLSYENQVMLLRVLQEKLIKQVGGSKDIAVDVRIIAATNEDLGNAINKGEFREDLYHRINEFSIEIAPLRKRVKDIELFAQHFLKIANKNLNKQIEGFETAALDKMKQHSWSGNLRELQNVIKRAVLMAQNNKIKVENLPTELGINFNCKTSDNNTIDSLNLKEIVENAEKTTIQKALIETNFNKSKTANLLGVDRKTLYNKLNQYNISH